MKTNYKELTRSLIFLCVAILIPATQANGQQSNRRTDSNRGSGWKTSSQIQQEEAKKGAPEFSEYELQWDAIETHQDSQLQVSGRDFQWEQEFTEGESPVFNAFEEELEPGRYAYSIGFIPNEIGELKRSLKDNETTRKDLLKRRTVAMEAGNREEAKSLYKRASQLRQQSNEIHAKQLSADQRRDYKFIKHNGQFSVYKDGTIKVFDLIKEREIAKADVKEQRESERAERRELSEEEEDTLRQER